MSGLYPRGELIQGPDGTLYGTAGPEGLMYGTVFKLQADGTGFTVLKLFTNRLDGADPNGGLVLADGVLYGTTRTGGESDLGTVFKVNTDGTGFAVLKHFSGIDGANPAAGLALSGRRLYGTTYSGGSSNCGTVFRLNTDGTDYTVLRHFSGIDGMNPHAPVIVAGQVLYGTTCNGGNANRGTVFKMSIEGSDYTVLKHFLTWQDGKNPKGPLVLAGERLYGTTDSTVFGVNTDGTDFRVLTYCSTENGVASGLVLVGDTLFVTEPDTSWSWGRGRIFKINTNGTGFTEIKRFYGIDGWAPAGALCASGNTLFGATAWGGSLGTYGSEGWYFSGFGTIFKINTDGTGFTVLKEFYMSDARGPRGPLATDGVTLFGTTENGGCVNAGAVFRVNTNGANPAVLKSFRAGRNDGFGPSGGVTLYDGALYGAAGWGLGDYWSVIYKLNSDGTCFTNLYVFSAYCLFEPLVIFDGMIYLPLESEGDLGIWGIFKFATNGTQMSVLTNFDSFELLPDFLREEGNRPIGELAIAGNVCYGVTFRGGVSNLGTIFKVNMDGTGLTLLKHFTGTDGANPRCVPLVLGDTLYGTTCAGGCSNLGVVYRLNTDGTGFTVLKEFTGQDGANPTRHLTLVGNTLYGTTYSGGCSNLGVVFRINTDGTAFAVVKHFTGTDGGNPDSGLVQCGSALYGTTFRGGAWGGGTVFKIDLSVPPEPIPLTAQLLDGAVVLSWTNPIFVLQAAPNFTGPYTNVPGATSPYTNWPSGSRQFYRLVANQ